MASKIGKALGYSMDVGETPREKSLGIGDADIDAAGAHLDAGPGLDDGPESIGEPADDEAPKAASAEVMAMKLFERATSPEAKVDALKAFLEACGAITGSY